MRFLEAMAARSNGGGTMAGCMLFMGGMSGSGSSQQHCILAIDDEETFLAFLTEVLECYGYRVITASSGDEAIQIYEERWREIDMVLLDFFLPPLTGEFVFDELQRVNPDVRVVLVTGYEKPVPFAMFQKGLLGSLKKPCSLGDLVQKVEDVIDTPAVSPTSPSAA
jgi:DNA-binding NtrC family response regulator